MKISAAIAMALAWMLGSGPGHAAEISSSFTALNGNDWQLSLTVRNEGRQPEVTGFTLYFAEDQYANLRLMAAPPTWDAIVIQPDRALSSPGFLDAFVRAPQGALTPGQSQAGFILQYTQLGTGTPQPMRFEFVDSNFRVQAFGQSAAEAPPVPEAGTAALMMLGMAVLAIASRRRFPPTPVAPAACHG